METKRFNELAPDTEQIKKITERVMNFKIQIVDEYIKNKNITSPMTNSEEEEIAEWFFELMI